MPKRRVLSGRKASSSGSIGCERVQITRTVVTTQDRAILEILDRKTIRVKFNGCVIVNIELSDRDKVFHYIGVKKDVFKVQRFRGKVEGGMSRAQNWKFITIANNY